MTSLVEGDRQIALRRDEFRSLATSVETQLDALAVATERAMLAAAAAELRNHAGEISPVVGELLRSVGGQRTHDTRGLPGAARAGGRRQSDRAAPEPHPRDLPAFSNHWRSLSGTRRAPAHF